MSGAGMSSAEVAPFQVIAIQLVTGNQGRVRLVADLIRERVNDDRHWMCGCSPSLFFFLSRTNTWKKTSPCDSCFRGATLFRSVGLDNRVSAPNVFFGR